MKKSTDSAMPAFWNQRYASGETPWVLHKIPVVLRSFLKRTRTKGRVLIPGCGTEPEPPPYPINKTQAAKIFGKYFRLLRDLKVSDSVPMFAGMERWQEWERTAMK